MPHEPQNLFLETVASPIGDLLLAVDGEAVCLLAFADEGGWAARYLQRHWPGHRQVRRPVPAPIRVALDAYFAGDVGALDRIAVRARGTTFQRQVWDELRRIAPGRTASYGEIAQRTGRPKAVRAAGLANARNPVSIIVPCHRVIGSDRSLTGYGGGLPRKAWLLRHEGVADVPEAPGSAV